jgi:hypothetical protein
MVYAGKGQFHREFLLRHRRYIDAAQDSQLPFFTPRSAHRTQRFFFKRSTHDFSGPPLLQEILTQETTASRSVFRIDSMLLTRDENNRGFEHESKFHEVNRQNSSTRFFFVSITVFQAD